MRVAHNALTFWIWLRRTICARHIHPIYRAVSHQYIRCLPSSRGASVGTAESIINYEKRSWNNKSSEPFVWIFFFSLSVQRRQKIIIKIYTYLHHTCDVSVLSAVCRLPFDCAKWRKTRRSMHMTRCVYNILTNDLISRFHSRHFPLFSIFDWGNTFFLFTIAAIDVKWYIKNDISIVAVSIVRVPTRTSSAELIFSILHFPIQCIYIEFSNWSATFALESTVNRFKMKK